MADILGIWAITAALWIASIVVTQNVLVLPLGTGHQLGTWNVRV